MISFKELFANLVDGKPRLKIEIQKLYYLYVQSQDRYAIMLEPVPYPSTYQVMVGIQNLGRRRTSIKEVQLEINKQKIPCVNQRGVEFGQYEYKQLLWVFPVDWRMGVKSGHYTLTIIDTFGNTFVRQGRFPVGTKVAQSLYERF
jgi:hypothetical protein